MFRSVIKLLTKTPEINPYIKNLLSFTNENKISNNIIWAILRDSEKSSKKEPLNNE